MIYVFVGSSGSGKTTISEKIFGKNKEVISFTTRKKRAGELDGIDYFFITKDEFYNSLKNKEILEYTEYANNFYGISKQSIQDKLSESDCYVVLDFNGFKSLLHKYPNKVIGVYIDISKEVMLERLKNRNELKSSISNRLELYNKEQEQKKYFNNIFINNGELDNTIAKIKKHFNIN